MFVLDAIRLMRTLKSVLLLKVFDLIPDSFHILF